MQDRRIDLLASAGEASRCVHAVAVAAAVIHRTFVKIFAMGFLAGLLVAVVANTLIRSHHVLAHAVGAYSAGSRAFVDIWGHNGIIANEIIKS